MAAKSYWTDVYVGDARSKEAVKSWFNPLCDDDMVPYRAEVLCDADTDREKKIRAFMEGVDGKRWCFVRTRGKTFSLSRKMVQSKQPVAA